jgi:hypothetical protein
MTSHDELLLKTLKTIQANLNDMSDVKADIRGLKGHVAACLDRIERRLGLNGEALNSPDEEKASQ